MIRNKYADYVLFILLAAAITGCQTVARTVYGAKSAKTENAESMSAWFTEQGLGNLQVYTIDPGRFEEFYAFYPNKRLIYSNLGTFLSIGFDNGKFCPKNFDDYLSTTKPYFSLYPKPNNYLVLQTPVLAKSIVMEKDLLITKDRYDNLIKKDTLYPNLSQINSFIRDLHGNKVVLTNDFQYDYTLVMSCAKFYGNRLQIKELIKYYKAAMKNPFARFKVILLDFDKQEWWGKEWNEKIQLSS